MEKRKWDIDFTYKAQWQFGLWLIPNSFWFCVHLFPLRLIISRERSEQILPIKPLPRIPLSMAPSKESLSFFNEVCGLNPETQGDAGKA